MARGRETGFRILTGVTGKQALLQRLFASANLDASEFAQFGRRSLVATELARSGANEPAGTRFLPDAERRFNPDGQRVVDEFVVGSRRKLFVIQQPRF